MSSLKCATKNPNIQKCATTSKKKKKRELPVEDKH